MEKTLPIFLLLLFENLTYGEIRISLDSDPLDNKWIVWNQNKSIQTGARVPGGIYTDLQSAGLLDDVLFYRFNDINYRWVSKENWTYQRVFDVPLEVLNKTAVKLVFHGVDTIGNIFLNGKLLASVNNMFVRYVLSIKDIVKEKNNVLEVQLKSPIYEADKFSKKQEKSYPVPPDCTPAHYNGECHVNFLRKMQASFAWDWGPAFPSMGIWKSVEIEAYDLGVIRDIVVEPTRYNSTTYLVNASYHIEFADSNKAQNHLSSSYITMQSSKKNERVIVGVMENIEKDSNVENGFIEFFQFYLEQDNTSLWWPNGFGKQILQNLTFTISTVDRTENSTKTIFFGIRFVELVEEELKSEKPGLSFYIKVNEIPIFAKGSNWIPGHVLPEHTYNKSMIQHTLESAKDANMNMLRVWGGGVYESDEFYSLADKLGILIWQDMMFACAMYPTNNEFLESVKVETQQQVRRLQYHPSIAIWAGNNENEAALSGDWYGTSKNFSLYKEDYKKLYVDTIMPIVQNNDKSRPYLISSPSNGMKTIQDGFVAKDPYSPLYGDVHYYNYFFDGWSDSTYPDTRFASEYGFQSMPSFQSLSKVTLPEDRKLKSDFSKKRQHLLGGNEFLLLSVLNHLPLSKVDDSEEFFKTFIYYSQITQAMSTKTETEKYRRDRSKLTSGNLGNTMGAMYWQLNDVWQAPSWSSIEFGGKWKMLQYFAKKFFSPVLVSSEKTSEGFLKVYMVSDLLYDVPNVRLNVSVYSWDSLIPKRVDIFTILVNKASSKVHASYELSDFLALSNCDVRKCFIYLKAEGPNFVTDNFFFPSALKGLENFKKANLKAEVERTENPNEVKVHVTTDQIAPFVWLETEEEGEFSDNGFLLLQKRVDLKFKSRHNGPVNFEAFKSTLTIRSITTSDTVNFFFTFLVYLVRTYLLSGW